MTAAALLPSLSMHDIFWRLPYSTVSWLFVQSARKKGVKGIGSKKTDDALFDRWQKLNGKKEDGKDPARFP